MSHKKPTQSPTKPRACPDDDNAVHAEESDEQISTRETPIRRNTLMASQGTMRGCSFNLDRSVYHRTQLAGLTTGCQFLVDDDQLVSYAHDQWCVFHLPEQAKAHWTSQQIENFNSDIFKPIRDARRNSSLLDLSGVVFPGPIEIGLEERVTRLPRALFLGCTFTADTTVRNVKFTEPVYFNGSVFRDQALLWNNIFLDEAYFDDVDFGPNVHLGGSRFMHNAYFQPAKLLSNVWCSDVAFAGRAWFQNALFAGYAYFENCSFGGEADFSASVAGDSRTAFPQLTFDSEHPPWKRATKLAASAPAVT